MVRKWENTAQELMFEQKWKNSTPFFIDYLKGSIYEVPIKKRLVVISLTLVAWWSPPQ
jgi:hypothetical protein